MNKVMRVVKRIAAPVLDVLVVVSFLAASLFDVYDRLDRKVKERC